MCVKPCRKSLYGLGVLLAFSSLTPRIALSDPVSTVVPAAQTPSLTVIPGLGVTRADNGVGVWNAGLVDPSLKPIIEQQFTLRNSTTSNVTITRLHAACGCTSLLLADGSASGSYRVLKPGQQTYVVMTLHMIGQPPGDLQKYAWVYGDSDTPLATLAINSTVRPAAAISPRFADFGTIAQGTTKTLTVQVTVDDAVTKNALFPKLVCTNPSITVDPVGKPVPAQRDGQPSHVQSYQIELTPQTPVGTVTGRIFLEAAGAAAVSTGMGRTPDPPPLFEVTGGVGGEVTGRLEATPQSLTFGSLPAGQEVTRQMVVTAATSAAAQSLTVSCASPWLSVRFLPQTSAASGTRILTVTLSAKAPASPIATQFSVVGSDGETLFVSVNADLTAAR